MRIRIHPLPLLLLALPVFCSSLISEKTRDVSHPPPLSDPTVPAPPAIRDTLPKPPLSKSDRASKDAPVDGAGEKPRKGSLVENPQNAAANPVGLEGGASAKEKEDVHLEAEVEKGEKSSKSQDTPTVALPLPQGESETLGTKETTANTKISGAEKAAEGSSNANPNGVHGILKPPKVPVVPYEGPTSHGEKDFDDDDDTDDEDDYDDKEGEHDALPFDSFIGAFLSILVTEIGDKTFLIAALMAMRHPRFQVFTAAASALLIMTVLSAITGHAVGSLMSKRFTALIAGLLFLLFGAKSMKEGLAMSPDQGVSEEMEEVRAELEEKEESMARSAFGRRVSSISPYALEAGRAGTRQSRSGSRLPIPPRSPSESPSRTGSPTRSSIQAFLPGLRNLLSLLLSPAWVETFVMTFLGELGDRSQIATVAMAAGQEYIWIMIGATCGHLICTGVAVLGGSALAGRVSMQKVTIIGAWVFIAFGLYTLYEALSYWHDD